MASSAKDASRLSWLTRHVTLPAQVPMLRNAFVWRTSTSRVRCEQRVRERVQVLGMVANLSLRSLKETSTSTSACRGHGGWQLAVLVDTVKRWASSATSA
ncbi:hypothetical protein ACJQWK_10858 [Exserohilum turcicum]